MDKRKTQIIFTKDSPLYVVNAECILDHEGQPIALKPVTALCKCGMSSNMPYCDQSHAEHMNETTSQDAPVMSSWKSYAGKEITIHFNLSICCHVGLCLKNLPTVFHKEKRPWINADGDSAASIIEAIEKCPSGALTYSVAGQEITSQEDRVRIKLVNGGPLVVRGPVELIDDENKQLVMHDHNRFTLCRCGKSKNKPFCDGSHRPPENP